jgi:hypothetical protein
MRLDFNTEKLKALFPPGMPDQLGKLCLACIQVRPMFHLEFSIFANAWPSGGSFASTVHGIHWRSTVYTRAPDAWYGRCRDSQLSFIYSALQRSMRRLFRLHRLLSVSVPLLPLPLPRLEVRLTFLLFRDRLLSVNRTLAVRMSLITKDTAFLSAEAGFVSLGNADDDAFWMKNFGSNVRYYLCFPLF